MADHPLRPATDHRLGRPLPHQLPNPTRAPPSAINLSPRPKTGGACGISRSFPRLSPTKGQVPTRYSPVRHSPAAETPGAFDLHVLGMPPAFVLSQDQTLKFIPVPSRTGSRRRQTERSRAAKTPRTPRERRLTHAAARASLPTSAQIQPAKPAKNGPRLYLSVAEPVKQISVLGLDRAVKPRRHRNTA